METKIEILSKELIKPESPTPDNLKCYTFSLLDQLAAAKPIPLLLYYHSLSDDNDGLILQKKENSSSSSRTLLLKKSLSRLLTHFHPFAGRINENTSIDCNDEGVPFFEAFAHDLRLENVVEQPQCMKLLHHLLPYEEALSTRFPLLVQVTFFECGGMSIGLCLTHKIADASSLSTLVHGWAAMAQGDSGRVMPEYVAAKLYPPIDQLPPSPMFDDGGTSDKCVTKAFMFNSSSISTLKAKAVGSDQDGRQTTTTTTTRVQAVSALMWKCAAAACKKPLVLTQTVNLRKRLVPALPDQSIGNLIGIFVACKGEKDTDLSSLVSLLKKGLLEYVEMLENKIRGNESLVSILQGSMVELGMLMARKDTTEIFNITSWCGLRLYDVDFGWGKPAWISIIEHQGKNVIVLMDRKDGGIEAWVTLKEEDMEEFLKDHELLHFMT